MTADKAPDLGSVVDGGFADIDTYIATMSASEALYWAGSLATGFAHALECHHELSPHQLRATGALQLRTVQRLLIHIAKTPGGVAYPDDVDPGFAALLARVVKEINQASDSEES